MTRIKYRAKPVWHETNLVDRMTGRVYVVAESPASLLIRLKGTRQVLSLPYSVAFLRAASLEASAKAIAKGTKQRRVPVTRGRM